MAVDAVPQFRCPVSFVDTVEQLKWAHVAKHVGENVAYFEADMVMQPGAGDLIRRALAGGDDDDGDAFNDFDVGFTYQPHFIQAHYDDACGDACGSINSGFVLWKNISPASVAFTAAVVEAGYTLAGTHGIYAHHHKQ